MKNYEEAIKNYQDVAATAQDIKLEEQSLYNIGNCLYRQGKLEESLGYYQKALDLDPDDQDAKYNLEFVREEIKKRINEAKQREQEQQNKNKEDGECKQPQQHPTVGQGQIFHLRVHCQQVKSMKRFLLADDNSALRSALRLMLETRLNAPLVFEAQDQASLLDQSITQRPECLILDWELPGLEDRSCLTALRELLPELKIIVISARPEAAEAASGQADAFICKTDPP